MSYENFGLSPELMNGLADTNLNEPTPLQQHVIPAALEGKHLLVKNVAEDEGAFLIPALQTLTTNGEVSGTRILILTPSIERAKKIDEIVWALGYHAQISPADLSMKGDKKAQEEAVQNGAPVIVANPGRLIDILEKTKHAFKSLATIIIDEAQAMDNFNLVSRVKTILKYVEGDPQVLVFASSMNKAARDLADFALKNPETIGFEEGEAEGSIKAPQKDDGKTPEERLEEVSVKVVLNPEEKEKQEEKEEEPKSESEEPADTEEGASQEEDVEKAIEELDHDPEEKLKEASVTVVLNPETKNEEDTSPSDSEEENTKAEETADTKDEAKEASDETDHDPEEKLKQASVKVVLKKDLPEEDEESAQKEDELAVPKNLEQGYIHVPPRMKISTLMAHLESEPIKKVIVFAASKRTTDRLFRIILKKNWGVVSVNEGIDQKTYDERFEKFTSGEMKILLVGGMSARDVEIDEVQQVINYDVPGDVDEYRYRAELVGNGKATRMVSLVSKMDREDIDQIVKEVGYAPEEIKLPEEVKEKKKKKSGGSDKNKKQKDRGGKNNNRSGNRGNKNNKSKNKQKSKPAKKEKKKGAYGLPRPSYEGLSGGREGDKNRKDTGGVFGWVKKLLD